MFIAQFVLCLVISMGCTEWVKLPDIELKNTIKTTTDSAIIKFVYSNNENVEIKNLTQTHFSYLDNLSSMFTTSKKEKVTRNTSILDIDIVTMKIPLDSGLKIHKPAHIVKVVIKPSNNYTPELNRGGNVTGNVDKNKVHKNSSASENNKYEFLNIKYFANIISGIQQHIFTKIPSTLNNKLKFLKNIRNTIMSFLDEQIGAMWVKNRRQKRFSEDDSHLDFPSSESALMTIGFLTFSVFLIKLVMQLIYILKTKKMMSVTPVTAVGRSYHRLMKDGNAEQDEDATRILKLMEDFKNK